MEAYYIVIASCLIIIISYGFNLIARRTDIPSVLLLIGLGMIITAIMNSSGVAGIDLLPFLEVLGIVGLILIVLEASLDLKLTKDKRKLIGKSFLIALSTLLLNTFLISSILIIYLDVNFFNCMIYAIPLSIASSAIIIPSVGNLPERKREFMIYEASLSDILGIIFFYFLLQTTEMTGFGEVSLALLGNLGLTVAVSIVISVSLIYIFQKIRSEAKLFLLISVLILLYSLGKMLHLSSLIIIMIFGLILENRGIFSGKIISKVFDSESVNVVYNDLKLITVESSFTVRTFFFVIFGMSIILSSLKDLKVIVLSIIIVAVLFGLRYTIFRLFSRKNFMPEALLSPRGLITLLLFYSIPDELVVDSFDPGILLFVIILSSIIMAITLIRNRKKGEDSDTVVEVSEETDDSRQISDLEMPGGTGSYDDQCQT